MFLRQSLNAVVVNGFQFGVNAVLHHIVYFRREVHRCAVRQMASLVQAHTHDRVARLKRSEVRRHIRLRPAVRLHIGVLRVEQLLRTADSQPLRDIHELAPAIVSPSRVSLRVLVRKHRPLRLQHRPARVVLGCNQVDVALLPLNLVPNRPPNLRVLFH